MTYRPRNKNDRTHDEPRSTSRWFDSRKDRPVFRAVFHMTDDGPVPLWERRS